MPFTIPFTLWIIFGTKKEKKKCISTLCFIIVFIALPHVFFLDYSMGKR
jgi:hypothetical protein